MVSLFGGLSTGEHFKFLVLMVTFDIYFVAVFAHTHSLVLVPRYISFIRRAGITDKEAAVPTVMLPPKDAKGFSAHLALLASLIGCPHLRLLGHFGADVCLV